MTKLRVDRIESVNGNPVELADGAQVNGVDVALENQGVRYVATKAAGTALAASLPDGVTVIVDADESWTPAGIRVRYTVASGALGGGVADEAGQIAADDGASGSLWTTIAGFITYLLSSLGASVIGSVLPWSAS